MRKAIELDLSCRCGCGLNNAIDEVRYMALAAVASGYRVSSASRCYAHNNAVCGSPKSQHLLGRAVDIVCLSDDKAFVRRLAHYFQAKKIIDYSWGLHIDWRED